MIVWGGLSGTDAGTLHADGAAYTPAARKWDVLKVSPLSPRTAAASVWTGTSLFIWGGNDDPVIDHQALDGTFYTPSTQTWTVAPAPPVTRYTRADALWTGTAIVLITVNADAGNTQRITAATLIPGEPAWTRLPDVQLPAGHHAMDFTAATADGTVYLWAKWTHTDRVGDVYQLSSGLDTFSLDQARDQWVPHRLDTAGTGGVDQVLWTGGQFLVGAAPAWCGRCPGPDVPNKRGFRLDPAGGAARPITRGPLDDRQPSLLWTGSAMIAVLPGYPNTMDAGTYAAAEAAAWDRTTDSWAELPPAPLGFGGSFIDVPAVWTGTSMLLWGDMYPLDGAATPPAGGLQLSL